MEWLDPTSGKVVWSSKSGLPAPGPRPDGKPYIKIGELGPSTPPQRVNALTMIGKDTGITPRLNALNQMFNPAVALQESSRHSINMLAPDKTPMERVGSLGGMLSGMAGTVAPMYAASRGAMPAADAVMEGIAGYSAMPRAVAGDFLADEFGGMKLYHGSPHDFDKFSMDKIGTGEGAQAYGHGLYFAENEGVAKGYRDVLAKSGTDGAQRRLQAAGGDVDAAIASATEKAAKYRAGGADGYAEAVEEDLRFLEKFKQTGEWTPGRMYEVDVNANPEDFLDWDAPLSAQPPKVRESAEKELRRYYGSQFDGQVGNTSRRPLGELLDQTDRDEVRKAARLKEAGIPGIKYLDAGSRGAGAGSRNYVVFDENLINIVKKYGIAGAAAMLGMSALDVEKAIAGQRE